MRNVAIFTGGILFGELFFNLGPLTSWFTNFRWLDFTSPYFYALGACVTVFIVSLVSIVLRARQNRHLR